MANGLSDERYVKIFALEEKTSLSAEDIMVIEDEENTKKISIATLRRDLLGNTDSITELIKQQLQESLDKYTEAVDKMISDLSEAERAEEERKVNEEERKANEEQRKKDHDDFKKQVDPLIERAENAAERAEAAADMMGDIIDDTAPYTDKTYSSSKVESLLNNATVKPLTIKLHYNDTQSETTEFDGKTAKTIDITAQKLGAIGYNGGRVGGNIVLEGDAKLIFQATSGNTTIESPVLQFSGGDKLIFGATESTAFDSVFSAGKELFFTSHNGVAGEEGSMRFSRSENSVSFFAPCVADNINLGEEMYPFGITYTNILQCGMVKIKQHQALEFDGTLEVRRALYEGLLGGDDTPEHRRTYLTCSFNDDDGSGNYLASQAIYENTSSTGSSNVYIASDGRLYRSTSASKYKLDIKPIEDKQYPYKILNLPLKQWYDKNNTEGYANVLTKLAENDELDEYGNIKDGVKLKHFISPVETIYGLIAEDVESAGLEKYCQYHIDPDTGVKTLEGIQYDKLCTLLIPICKDLVEENQKLKEKINDENFINMIYPIDSTYVSISETFNPNIVFPETIWSLKTKVTYDNGIIGYIWLRIG